MSEISKINSKVKIGSYKGQDIVSYKKTGNDELDMRNIRAANWIAGRKDNAEVMILDEDEDLNLKTIFSNNLYTNEDDAKAGKNAVNINTDSDVWNYDLEFVKQDNGTYLVKKKNGDGTADDYFGFIDKDTYNKYQAAKNSSNVYGDGANGNGTGSQKATVEGFNRINDNASSASDSVNSSGNDSVNVDNVINNIVNKDYNGDKSNLDISSTINKDGETRIFVDNGDKTYIYDENGNKLF